MTIARRNTRDTEGSPARGRGPLPAVLVVGLAAGALAAATCGGGGETHADGDGDARPDATDVGDADDGETPADGEVVDADGGAADVDPDAVRVPLWHPYAEWTFDNAVWEGNPFDVQAEASFGDGRRPHLFHDGGTTWRLRYMCTEVGTFAFTTSSPDPELDGRTGTVICEPNPGAMGLLTAGGPGNRRFLVRGWERAIVPAWVMIPDISRNSEGSPVDPAVLDAWIAANIDGTGFLGAHDSGPANIWYDWDCDGTRAGCASEDPDPRTFRAYERLMERLYERGAFLHLWLFWDCARDKCDKFHDDAPRQERMRHYLADRWGAIPNWMVGEGFDNFEDDDTAFADKWHRDIQGRLAWPHLLGIRSYHDSYDRICTECSYESWENVSMDWARWQASADAATDRPSFEEDRYRVRDEGRPKDIPPDRLDLMLRNHLWPQAMVGGVGAIYGYLYGSPGSYSLVDGYPDAWSTAIRAWHDFWYAGAADPVHRFLPEMEGCDDLTDGRGLCVRGRDYVFYREDTTRIAVDLSALPGPAPALALDTWTGEVVDPGPLGPTDTEFVAPHASDWALAVGRFE